MLVPAFVNLAAVTVNRWVCNYAECTLHRVQPFCFVSLSIHHKSFLLQIHTISFFFCIHRIRFCGLLHGCGCNREREWELCSRVYDAHNLTVARTKRCRTRSEHCWVLHWFPFWFASAGTCCNEPWRDERTEWGRSESVVIKEWKREKAVKKG